MTISMDKKYRTRDGRDVRLLCVDGPGMRSVIGIYDGILSIWTPDGLHDPMRTNEHHTDLIEYREPDIRTIWVNVYEDRVTPYETAIRAMDCAGNTCISIAQPVTFEAKRA